jgi:hypothetical protein
MGMTRTFPVETILDAVWEDCHDEWPRPECPHSRRYGLTPDQLCLAEHILTLSTYVSGNTYTLTFQLDGISWKIDYCIDHDGNELFYTEDKPTEFLATRVRQVSKQVTVWEAY